MRLLEDMNLLPGRLPYPVMAIGVFDGFHLGHQAILKRVVRRARERQGTSLILSFDPHPQKIIAAHSAPDLLQTPEQKTELLRTFEIDFLVQLAFTRELSLFSPERFASEILHRHGIREIHVGSNFRFGHCRSGDFNTLRELGQKYSFEAHETKPVCFRGTRVSSTRIRKLLLEGRVALAKRLLGRPYQIVGTVGRGEGRGSRIGFPTANLQVENELIPASGVYATRFRLAEETFLSVTNVGVRPTFERADPTTIVESYLLDFQGSLYGRRVRLEFCLGLRSEIKFPDAQALKHQICRDIKVSRRYASRVAHPSGEKLP